MSIVYECCLSRLGSRLCLNFRPRQKAIFYSAVGQFFDAPTDVAIGVRVGRKVRCLPFTSRYQHFETTEQTLTPTSVTFRGESRELGVRLVARFTAPYYPRDVNLSTAPFFDIDLSVERLVPKRNDPRILDQKLRGEVFFRLRRKNCSLRESERTIRIEYTVRARHRFLKDEYDRMSPKEVVKEFHCSDRIEASRPLKAMPFVLGREPVRVGHIIWAGHVAGNVLAARGEFLKFKYGTFFSGAAQVIRYAQKLRKVYLKRSAVFDSLVMNASLSPAKRDLLSFCLQGYLANTWWCVREKGPEWFSCWEGSCHYHSTVDVEYNAAVFNLLFWPELLEMTVREWHHHVKDGYLSHDMGDSFLASGQFYRHDMPIEENTNFILIVWALWRHTGRRRVLSDNFGLVRRFVDYIESADKNGNGFPDEGTANTIDDASAALQSSGEQTYLAVKCYSACVAAAGMAEARRDEGFRKKCLRIAARIRRTLDGQAWLGDHYAVSISSGGAVDLLTGSKIKAKDVAGKDAYSIYAANGLLYLLMTATPTGLRLDRMRKDIASATQATLTEYGCAHTSADRGNVWISQNMWRDAVAAYLGVDMLDMAERYWAFEQFENSQGRGGCFVDTYGWNYLRYYPRGVTIFALPYALGGVRVDKVKREVSLWPVRVPCRVALPSFADWEDERVPWAAFSIRNGRVRCAVENSDLLRGYKLIFPARGNPKA